MIESFQSISMEEGNIDRISSLPRNVINRILELMPVDDAARTCVLSTRFTNIWSEHPTLVLDGKFWDVIKQKRGMDVDIVDIVNRIFLCHYGHINKFVIDISVMNPDQHRHVDLWLTSLCKRGVNVLHIIDSESHSYIVRPCVFKNVELTVLGISNCALFRPNNTCGDFRKLVTLSLDTVRLIGLLPIFALLTSLTLQNCCALSHISISAPQLVSLNVCNNYCLDLLPFLSCKNMKRAYISLCPIPSIDCPTSIDLVTLFRSWPRISEFLVDGASLKYLTRGTVPEEFPCLPNLRYFVPFWIDCEFNQLRWILCILKNSPVMSNLEIWFSADVNDLEVSDLEVVVSYLGDPNTMRHMIMEQLQVVKMRYFRASRDQILLTKILLRCAPSLKQVLVEENEKLDPIEQLRISRELMRLPRASPNAEMIFVRNLFPVEDVAPCLKFNHF